MDRDEFIAICDAKLKLVRTEYGFSQEKMAVALGISKKTLVEIEKGRRSLGWTTSVALCSIFSDSEILSQLFGGKATDIILALAFKGERLHFPKTMKGRIWWSNVMKNEGFVIQQNIVSQHYRLLTSEGRRVASSFQLDDLITLFHDVERGDGD